jgi:hypothetical protein
MTLEQQYNKVVEQNKQLQGELALANKVIEMMATTEAGLGIGLFSPITKEDITDIINSYKQQAKQELISLTK